MGQKFVTTTKDMRAHSNAPRPSGKYKGLGLAAFATALLTMGSVAHADVFAPQANNQVSEQVLQRLVALESEMRAMKDVLNPAAAPGGPGNLSLPVPPGGTAGLVSQPKTYRVVGEVNGKFLIRAGASRLLLSEEELSKFDKEESARAAQAAASAPDKADATGKPMPPPPMPPVKASATTADAGKPAAPVRAGATPKPAAAKPVQPASVRN